MDRIKQYIDSFFAGRKMNEKYDMRATDWMELAASEQSRCDVIGTAFNFGYAKGYRAALAEMKMKGARA